MSSLTNKLAELDGGLPNLHIGVVTSDMGTSATRRTPSISEMNSCVT